MYVPIAEQYYDGISYLDSAIYGDSFAYISNGLGFCKLSEEFSTGVMCKEVAWYTWSDLGVDSCNLIESVVIKNSNVLVVSCLVNGVTSILFATWDDPYATTAGEYSIKSIKVNP